MPVPNLNIETVAGSRTEAPPDPLTELFLRAMESERGVACDCGSPSQAVAYRLKLYKHRNSLRKAGNKSFNGLIMRIVGGEVHIVPPPSVLVRDL